MKQLNMSISIVFLFLISISNGNAQTEKPVFWRGIYLFGLPEPTNAERFFSHLADSLHLNMFQVRTYGYAAGKDRMDFFLRNERGLKVITQSSIVAGASKDADMPAVESEVRALVEYDNSFRLYLADEPKRNELESFVASSRKVKQSHRKAKAVTALVSDHDLFMKSTDLSEVLLETYFFTNNTPHPSLQYMDDVAVNAGIVAWGDSGYGWYLGGVQQQINQILTTWVHPAIESAQKRGSKIPLIFVPQLHGILDSKTHRYDTDDTLHSNLQLRPPSPSEIRLQYSIGLAYGAKGFLAFPYGFDAGYERAYETFPGIVSGDPSQVDHSNNFDTIYGKKTWTGYNEKWHEVAAQNKRLKKIEETLLGLTWMGTKRWTMNHRDWTPLTETVGKWSGLVSECSARTLSGYRDDLPQVEVGHLRKGNTDYLVVVNRRSANNDKARITLTINAPNKTYNRRWRATDIERGVSIRITSSRTFGDMFEPGEGKIYKITF